MNNTRGTQDGRLGRPRHNPQENMSNTSIRMDEQTRMFFVRLGRGHVGAGVRKAYELLKEQETQE